MKPPIVDTQPASPGPLRFQLTGSQQRCFEQIMARADLFFSQPEDLNRGRIPVQTNSLLLGPTGSGKTVVARAVADALGANFMHLTYGTWIVDGAQDTNSTMRTILWQLRNTPPLVLFIDEIDKFAFGSSDGTGWNISVRNDLWMILDRALPWAVYEVKGGFITHFPKELRSAKALESMFNRKVFIIGAGTWQHLQRPKPGMGFIPGRPSPVDGEQITSKGNLPEEVLRRFNNDLLSIEYPTAKEIGDLLASDGLPTLASEVGQAIDTVQLREQMDLVGMTTLTTFKTNLLLRRRAAQRLSATEPSEIPAT
jgi:SpoVK/Ycf46/Vps4 family AAA+-type ATPase